tara:strand:- start:75364 stop:76551 length:1188 start_codon:yes stop_codon:yes gene_type:complete
MKKTVVVAMSGGVDSSVAAYLLKEKKYNVIGLFMKNWHDTSVTLSDECPWLEDSYDAMTVAEKLKIPFQSIDLSDEYKSKIVDYMIKEYKEGRTPNPDILCNKEIKFDIFLKKALSLGADFIATGHYARKIKTKNGDKIIYNLLSGKDKLKDQSYFLCQLNQGQISKILFPIGGLEKSKVRYIAKKQNLATAEKRDSQGLCFIGKVKLPDFLKQKLIERKGNIILIEKQSFLERNKESFHKTFDAFLDNNSKPSIFSLEDGDTIGYHNGAHFYTVGQRKGLSIGGTNKPLYILKTDVKNNIIYVGEGNDHPGLFRRGIAINREKVHWLREDIKLCENEFLKVKSRIRYRQKLKNSYLYMRNKKLFIIFDSPISSISEGQFVVWYLKNELIGSAAI